MCKSLQYLFLKAIDDLYSDYSSDMQISEGDFEAEITRWRQKKSGIDPNVNQMTLVDTLDLANLEFYPGVYVAVITFMLTYLVSTCTEEFENPFTNTMTDGRLSSLAILHIHKHKDIDNDDIRTEFAHMKGRHLALCL